MRASPAPIELTTPPEVRSTESTSLVLVGSVSAVFWSRLAVMILAPSRNKHSSSTDADDEDDEDDETEEDCAEEEAADDDDFVEYDRDVAETSRTSRIDARGTIFSRPEVKLEPP